jgi:hypothetical protein
MMTYYGDPYEHEREAAREARDFDLYDYNEPTAEEVTERDHEAVQEDEFIGAFLSGNTDYDAERDLPF